MDYTIQELRPLIYKNRKDIDKFDINNAQALDAEMLRKIESSEIIKLDAANRYILDIFNNAYYITTLIMMERHPVHYLSKYILIAEHTSSAYDDIYQKNSWFRSFSAIIMAMVNNFLRLLDDQRFTVNNIFIKQLNSHFNDIGNHYTSDELRSFQLYNDFILNDNLKDYCIKRDSFKPRPIDYHAVSEMEDYIYNKKKSNWRKFTNDYNEERIAELFDFCGNEYSASFLADYIRREAEGFCQEETIEFINTLDWKRLSKISPDEATIENKYAWLKLRCCRLQDEIQKLKTNNKSTSVGNTVCSDDSDAEKKKLIEELTECKEKVKGLSREKAALFVLSMANAFGFNLKNKKKDLAPIVNYLFGWGIASSQKKLCEGFSASDSEELAKIFDALSPRLSEMIRNKGEVVKNNEVTPEVTPTEK